MSALPAATNGWRDITAPILKSTALDHSPIGPATRYRPRRTTLASVTKPSAPRTSAGTARQTRNSTARSGTEARRTARKSQLLGSGITRHGSEMLTANIRARTFSPSTALRTHAAPTGPAPLTFLLATTSITLSRWHEEEVTGLKTSSSSAPRATCEKGRADPFARKAILRRKRQGARVRSRSRTGGAPFGWRARQMSVAMTNSCGNIWTKAARSQSCRTATRWAS